MITAYLESLRYVGHLWPVSLLRIVLGYQYVERALARYQEGYFSNAYINENIRLALPTSVAPEWYRNFLEKVVQENWKLFAYCLTSVEFLIGISFLIGYFVRPFAALGIILSINLMWALGSAQADFYQTQMYLHFMMLLLGAGRCLGLDYYFYRRRRGLWW